MSIREIAKMENLSKSYVHEILTKPDDRVSAFRLVRFFLERGASLKLIAEIAGGKARAADAEAWSHPNPKQRALATREQVERLRNLWPSIREIERVHRENIQVASDDPFCLRGVARKLQKKNTAEWIDRRYVEAEKMQHKSRLRRK